MPNNFVNLGDYVNIRTGKLDANANDPDGLFPFFTCAKEPLQIATFSYDCECVLVAGNGDLNVKYYNGKFDAYQRTYIIESLNKELLDVRYLFHFMEQYLERLRHMSIGGVIKYIKIGNLTEARLHLPPLPEQRRIAAILDQADQLRVKRREALAELDRLTQSIFVEMFGDVINNDKGWQVSSLFDCSDLIQIGPFGTQLHQEDYIENGIPLVNPTHIKAGRIVPDISLSISDEKYAQLKQYHLIEGDIVLGRRGEMGRCAVVTKKEHGWLCGTGSLFVRLKAQTLSPSFLEFILSSNAMRSYLENVAQGVTMANLNKTIVGALPIILPPIELQRKFAKSVELNDKQKLLHLESLSSLESLFTSLQHRAFRGEL